MSKSISCVTSPVGIDSSAPTPHASNGDSYNMNMDSVQLCTKSVRGLGRRPT